MKKLMLLLLTAAALAVLAGCGAQKAQEDTPPPAPGSAVSPVPEDPEVLPPPAPPEEVIRYLVSPSVREETVCTDDGTVLFNGRFQLPMLTAYRDDDTAITEAQTEKETAALAAADAFNRKFSDWDITAEIQDAVGYAREDYAWRKQENLEWGGEYALDFSYAAYQTRRMISVSGIYYSYTGGAHPNTVYLAWNFDLENGAFFGPEVLGDGAALQEAVTAELVRQCGERAKEYGMQVGEMFWADYETILADWPSFAISFDDAGMTISFSPYELAAYAAGAQIFEISYEFLRPYLSAQGLALLGLADEPGT